MPFARLAALFCLLIAVMFAAPGPAHARPESPEDAAGADPCAAPIAAAERRHGIPHGLLAAISRAESGRYNPERAATSAWPWTINAEGQGKFFPSKAAAVAHVRDLHRRGVSSVDVGCMQVNLHHHPDAFDDLDQAFDPGSNVDYAAEFLSSLFEETRSWSQAVAFYHSRAPEHHGPYRAKVFQFWGEGQRRQVAAVPDRQELRRQQLAAWQQERRDAQMQRIEELRRRLAALDSRPQSWRPTRPVPLVTRP